MSANPDTRASTGKPCERCVWQHALCDSWANASKQEAVTVLVDIIKCYEQVPHQILVEEIVATGYPIRIARVCVAIYRATRFITVDSCVG